MIDSRKETTIILLGAAVCAGICLPAACETETGETAWKPEDIRPIAVRYTEEPIVIDGRAEEWAWQEAEQVGLDWYKRRGKRPGPGTLERLEKVFAYARLLWDEENLYLFAVCRDRDLMSTLEGRDSRLWTEDVMELFVMPGDRPAVYWEYQWSPTLQVTDARWVLDEQRSFPKSAAWNGTGEFAVRVRGTLNDSSDTDGGWQIEVRIPFSDFAPAVQGPPAPGATWHGAVVTYNYLAAEPKATVHTALTCPCVLTHQVERYNPLVFEK